MKNKHAYMLLIHGMYEQVARLLKLLDSCHNDFYIHVDKKSPFSEKEKAFLIGSLNESRIYFTEREDVSWGDESMLRAELILFHAAAKGEYHYYHLLSGVDLPLLTSEAIYQFFENSEEAQFVQFMGSKSQEHFQDRVRYRWYFQKRIMDPKTAIKNKDVRRIFLFALQKCFLGVQKVLGVDRREKGIIYAGGSQWISITHSFMKYILQKEEWILRTFEDTCCCDELFVQTVMINSPFYVKRFAPDTDGSCRGNQRYIDWKRGRPYVFQDRDLDELTSCGYLFARKFDMSRYPTIVDDICAWVEGK